MELREKKVLVVGLARTGIECARFLLNQGAKVSVSDLRSETDLKREIDALNGLPIRYLLAGQERRWLEEMDLVVPSPGVAAENPLLQEACSRGIEILSEIELAYRFSRFPIVAITGTNGKSTTTTLVGEMLKANGTKAFTGGNIGAPLIGFVGGDWEWGVVEISSFQLEWIAEFRPQVAVVLNLSEDHLDRYPNFAAYCRAKERILENQTAKDIAVLNRDDSRVWALRQARRARITSFGFSEVDAGVFAKPEEIVWRDGSTEERFPLGRVKIQGVHNLENMMAAIAVAKAVGVRAQIIQQTLEEFLGLEHRLEFVREKDGVRYYNDSKGTNVGAVVKSLASFSVPVILLAGGVDKGGDYGVLRDGVGKRVKRLVLFGAAKEMIAKALGALTETVIVDSMEAAVREAHQHARPGDVVLLSPACSSFDMFRNYAERGRVFKSLVQAL
ncbi:MAG TPA: UDP-N-acetylmuramoyl-L-alanine--D-glutamate ligase [Candidatus Binatia bacterium]|nr:UDP-N-acetylmuramoyl-L-alanine--D-glutamate ligase [Candidatus Binatia bacterium]